MYVNTYSIFFFKVKCSICFRNWVGANLDVLFTWQLYIQLYCPLSKTCKQRCKLILCQSLQKESLHIVMMGKAFTADLLQVSITVE